MTVADRNAAAGVVAMLLQGTVLDSIRAYSLVLQLGFVRLGSVEMLPSEVWVTLSRSLQVGRSSQIDDPGKQDFFSSRAAGLRDLYLLIGKSVTSATVQENYVLNLVIDGQTVAVSRDKENLEEVWKVVSDGPECGVESRWAVTLDDAGEISLRSPN